MIRPRNLALTALLCICVPAVAPALESDRDQVISITADSALFSEQDGSTRYDGKVVLLQGSIGLEADVVTLYSRDGKIIRIIAEGQPAVYRQTPAPGEPDVEARGLSLDYRLDEDIIYLSGQAEITQAGTALRGNSIVYDVRQNTLRASGTPGDNTERVEVVIPPTPVPEAP